MAVIGDNVGYKMREVTSKAEEMDWNIDQELRWKKDEKRDPAKKAKEIIY